MKCNFTYKETLSLFKELLQKYHSEEQVLKCLKEPVIRCKGACQASIMKLSRLKNELQAIESDICRKFC